MRTTIDELISQAALMLAELGYVPETIRHYKKTWNTVRQWCSERGIECFDSDSELQLINDLGLNENILSPHERGMLRHIRMLLSLNEHGSLPSFSRRLPEPVPVRFRQLFDAYLADLQQRGLAPSTLRGQRSLLRKFLIGLKIEDFAVLSMEDITAHIESCSSMAAQTKAGILYTMRSFTHWAADQGFCSPDVAASMPVIPGHKHACLPSVYAINEVAAMVGAVGGQCLKRDRAMVILASVLGMRAGDIRGLRMSNIDWRIPEIRFVQPKTGNQVTLPLPEEVMLALADYLQNERPPSQDSHVFLHHRAPHESFEDALNAFHYVATKAYHSASVNTEGKHHGMHSLRHSAATNMLSGGTAYPVISGILGHSNANTTRKYMAIDIESLRSLSLEVPRG